MDSEALQSGIQTTKNGYKLQDKELLRQTEISYNVEFNIQELERRIANMKGTSNDRSNETDIKIQRLENMLKRKTADKNLIVQQLSDVKDDMKKMTLAYNNDIIELEKLVNRLKERQMNADGGEKDVKKFTQITQERLVETSILKMRANQMGKQIKKHANKCYNLERHKIELETAMNERLIDIKAQRDILTMKRKYLIDEISQLKADIGERVLKIEVLKKRYECTLDLLGKNEDGTVITATQIKIKTAQEKYILLKEGNELNERVQQAETDIKAMENTLRVMNYSNANYRKSFDTLDEDNPQMIELQELQQQYCKSSIRLKNCRSNLMMKNEQLTEMNRQKEDLDRIIEDITRMRLDSNDVLLKVHKELLDQKVKLQRAERELKAAIKAAKMKITDPLFMASFEKDLLVKEIEERNSSALQQLADLVDNNDEIGPSLSKYLFERGLSMPVQISRTKSQTSWRSNYSLGAESNGLQIGAGGSDYSIQVVSASSKLGSSASSSSLVSKVSTNKIAQTPSIVMIGFPGNVTMRTDNTLTSRSSTSTVKRSKF